eukprot:CAMPEP_0179103422 /NCGR_PEP_ID=MMETSP0796-20121207/47922_1 /TAXON_ID=73915 /ORGANISM="Pyrodinium bahamense, Strain pbaha01" /LENGTH=103 /DNA_ID=CAMNT_0020801333 /DNA_START=69 /DNA_END=377 /DNA_ORIENTATION=-
MPSASRLAKRPDRLLRDTPLQRGGPGGPVSLCAACLPADICGHGRGKRAAGRGPIRRSTRTTRSVLAPVGCLQTPREPANAHFCLGAAGHEADGRGSGSTPSS